MATHTAEPYPLIQLHVLSISFEWALPPWKEPRHHLLFSALEAKGMQTAGARLHLRGHSASNTSCLQCSSVLQSSWGTLGFSWGADLLSRESACPPPASILVDFPKATCPHPKSLQQQQQQQGPPEGPGDVSKPQAGSNEKQIQPGKMQLLHLGRNNQKHKYSGGREMPGTGSSQTAFGQKLAT